MNQSLVSPIPKGPGIAGIQRGLPFLPQLHRVVTHFKLTTRPWYNSPLEFSLNPTLSKVRCGIKIKFVHPCFNVVEPPRWSSDWPENSGLDEQ